MCPQVDPGPVSAGTGSSTTMTRYRKQQLTDQISLASEKLLLNSTGAWESLALHLFSILFYSCVGEKTGKQLLNKTQNIPEDWKKEIF